ncbi:MAG: tetratricopeptide repeat protein [Thermodesulfobacteriota bacterium]
MEQPSSPTRSLDAPPRLGRTDAWIMLGLALAVLVIYAQSAGFSYINFDDPIFIQENPVVLGGLNWDGLRYAFTESVTASNYFIPLTWLSHMAAVSLFGAEPGPAHMVNVLIHLLNCLLCYLAFFRLTGRRWESAFAAALFAVHPIHVESVAWVTERKDVLSGLFFFLTLLSYNRYARKPGPGWYCAALAFYLLGLLSKPMLVTLPCVLLLLDYWPLQRMADFRKAARLLAEKLPFFLPVIVVSVLAFHYQERAGGLGSMEAYSLYRRIAAASTGYFFYMKKMFLPLHLAVSYPYPDGIPVWQTAAAIATLLAALASCFALRRRAPWITVGFLWFFGMLLPVSGLFVIGMYAVADRYAYLTFLGPYLALAISAGAAARQWSVPPRITAVAAAGVLASLILLAMVQASFWKNPVLLFRRTLAVTENNYTARMNLGSALGRMGQCDQAIEQLMAAHELFPDRPEPYNNIGACLLTMGEAKQALPFIDRALALRPGYEAAKKNRERVLGMINNEGAAVGQRQEK